MPFYTLIFIALTVSSSSWGMNVCETWFKTLKSNQLQLIVSYNVQWLKPTWKHSIVQTNARNFATNRLFAVLINFGQNGCKERLNPFQNLMAKHLK